MSKSVAIKEGDTPKNFNNVKRIRINNVGGGSSYWVPEDETKLGTKSINKNGTYKASEEKDDQGHNLGLYGYSQVTVSGIGSVDYTAQAGDQIGGIPLEEGEGYTFEEEEEGGGGGGGTKVKLTPESIRFDEQPSRVRYDDGEEIDLAGSIVRAYSKKGKPIDGDSTHPHGVIPYAELELIPDKADITKVTDETYTDGHIEAIKCVFDEAGDSYWPGVDWYYYGGDLGGGLTCTNGATTPGSTIVYLTKYNGVVYGASENGEIYCNVATRAGTGRAHVIYTSTNTAGNRVFRPLSSFNEFYSSLANIPTSDRNPLGVLLDGLHVEGGVQEITVKWKLKEKLTTILPIHVISEDFEIGGGGHEF